MTCRAVFARLHVSPYCRGIPGSFHLLHARSCRRGKPGNRLQDWRGQRPMVPGSRLNPGPVLSYCACLKPGYFEGWGVHSPAVFRHALFVVFHPGSWAQHQKARVPAWPAKATQETRKEWVQKATRKVGASAPGAFARPVAHVEAGFFLVRPCSLTSK